MATVLDTHRIARRFRDAGVPEAQTEVMLETLVEWRAADVSQLASKDDLRVLTAELAAMESRLRAEIAGGKADILKWIIPLLAGQILALMALVVQLALKGP